MTTKLKMTEAKVRKLALALGETDKTTWDTEVRGLGRRLRPKSASWIMRYEYGRRSKRMQADGGLTVDAARKWAQEALGEIARGKDPAAEVQAKRSRRRNPSKRSVTCCRTTSRLRGPT